MEYKLKTSSFACASLQTLDIENNQIDLVVQQMTQLIEMPQIKTIVLRIGILYVKSIFYAVGNYISSIMEKKYLYEYIMIRVFQELDRII